MNINEKRFWNKVNKNGNTICPLGPCWEWIGSRGQNGNGYGQIRIDKKLYNAHRIAYEIQRGAIPSGMNVLHKCDNRACVNPLHLYLGNQSENIYDCIAKGRHKSPLYKNRSKTHCPKGHEYNAENTYSYKGERHCKVCKKARQDLFYEKRRKTKEAALTSQPFVGTLSDKGDLI